MASSLATEPGPPQGEASAFKPSVIQIFLAFAKVGLTSFGGGLSGWMFREFVEHRAWLKERDFLSILALAQSFPGVNVVNLAIWIGYRLRGNKGAAAGFLGIVVPAIIVAIIVVNVFDQLLHFSAVHALVIGFAAAAIGLSLRVGLRMGRNAATGPVPILIMGIVFICIVWLRIPLVFVVLVAAPISIGYAFLHPRLRSRS